MSKKLAILWLDADRLCSKDTVHVLAARVDNGHQIVGVEFL